MEVFLATPDKKVFSGAASDVLVNAEKGQINILEKHANLITLVKPGVVRIRGAQEKNFQVGEGVLKVENDRVSILCKEVRES
ncbi:MAG: atpC [Bacteriovoracaceae bacterium]|nr:atpC [Bacteriovoracaceae bacterium]